MALAPLLNPAGLQLYWILADGQTSPINPRAISNTLPPAAPNPSAGFSYIPVYKEAVVPDYDPRLTVLTTLEGLSADKSQVQITYSVSDQPVPQVNAAIDNAKQLQAQQQFPAGSQLEDMTICLAACMAQIQGLKLTADQQARMTNIQTIAAALTQNAQIATQLKTAVAAGQKPDIDAAWVPVAS